MKAPSESNQRKEHNAEKYIWWGFIAVAGDTDLSSFVQLLLPPKSAISRIAINFLS